MKPIKLSILSLLLVTANSVMAAESQLVSLQKTHAEIIQQYIHDLGTADYKDITQLFDKNGFVITNSQGKTDAKTFFYSFLSNVTTASTSVQEMFSSTTYINNDTARFHFQYQMKDGTKGHGEYIDEFVFVENSDKLAAVFMFENLNFEKSER